MAHLVLQDVDPRVIESLSARAARQGRSVEEEARAVLEGALGFSRLRALEGARRLRAQWVGRPLTASDELMARDAVRLSEGSGGHGSGSDAGGELGDGEKDRS
jgi:plasmid stability protein